MPELQSDHPYHLAVNSPLPLDIRFAMASQQASGILSFSHSLIFMMLPDMTKADLKMFRGPAKFRVMQAENFLLCSPNFGAFSFDLIWSPAIAQSAGEDAIEPVADGEHLLLNFVLCDQKFIVRGIRTASISYEAAEMIATAQRQLTSKSPDAGKISAEANELFRKHPRGIPDHAFQCIAMLGS